MTLVVMEAFRIHEIELGRRVETDKDREPLVLKMLKLMSNLISRRTGAKANVIGLWDAWAKEKQIDDAILPSFLGHRFNIVFENSEKVNHIYPAFVDFIKETKLYTRPDVKQALAYLEDPVIICHIKVLAFMNLTVCAPILRLSGHSRTMFNTIEWLPPIFDWINQSIDLIETIYELDRHPMIGKEFDYDSCNKRFSEIMLRDELDVDFFDGLMLALDSSRSHISFFFGDYLPGGKYFEHPEAHQEILKIAPSNNNAAEGVFAYLDFLEKTKPSMGHIRKEAVILINKNKTIKWLQNLDPDQQEALVSECRAKRKGFAKEFKHKMATIEAQKLEKLRQETLERAEQERKDSQRVDVNINNMIEKGIWQNEAIVESKLFSMPNDAIKFKELSLQLAFRRFILKQNEPFKCFTTTAKEKKLSVEELKNKLLQLISLSYKFIPVHDDY
uniref:Uncharacterized protein n=1 Tax=Acrobeloides nanus TaxID=290746 RepID=A0A914D0Y3_9BILA